MVVNTNIQSIGAHRNMKKQDLQQVKSTTRLSSGLKLNSAADDAAGLAISEKMLSQIRGLKQASINSSDASNLLMFADGVLDQITSMTHRMRELAVYAANDTNEYEDRIKIQEEMAQLTAEIDKLAETADWNKKMVFDGSCAGTYTYNYGLREAPTWIPKDPAQIRANSVFQSVRVPRGTQAERATRGNGSAYGSGTTLSGSYYSNHRNQGATGGYTTYNASSYEPYSHLKQLEEKGFPVEGIFAIRIQYEGTSGVQQKDFILDFATTPITTQADFIDYFQDAFDNFFYDPSELPLSLAPGEERTKGATITLGADGVFTVKTNGLGGANARVTLGVLNAVDENGNVLSVLNNTYANSAIFGTYRDTYDPESYRVKSDKAKLTVATRGVLDADISTFGAVNSTMLWDLVPDTYTFYWTMTEDRYTLQPNGSYSRSTYAVDSISFTKAQLEALGANDFATANTALAVYLTNPANTSDTYFTSVSLGSPSYFVDRDGQAYVNFNFSYGRTSSYPAFENTSYGYHFYDVATPGTTSIQTNYNNTLPSVYSNYAARIPQNSGILTISVSGIQTSATTTATKTIDIDFSTGSSDRTALDALILGGMSEADALVQHINTLLNTGTNLPYQAAEFQPTGYDFINFPVARASLDGSGRLVITAAEHQSNITIQERMSDRPMFIGNAYEYTGENRTATITISDDNGNTKNINIQGRDYADVNDFINANRDEFWRQGFILSNEGGKLIITSRERGKEVTVDDIRIWSNYGTYDWDEVFKRMGLFELPPDNYIDGFDHPRQPVSDNSLWVQTGANANQGLKIAFCGLNALDLGLMLAQDDIDDYEAYQKYRISDLGAALGSGLGPANYADWSTFYSTSAKGMAYSLNVTDHVKAGGALFIIDNALNIVTTERSILGAQKNRLEHTIASLDISDVNLQASLSRIRDADMAKETMDLTKANALQQAATSMLTQANQQPERVVGLLRP